MMEHHKIEKNKSLIEYIFYLTNLWNISFKKV